MTQESWPQPCSAQGPGVQGVVCHRALPSPRTAQAAWSPSLMMAVRHVTFGHVNRHPGQISRPCMQGPVSGVRLGWNLVSGPSSGSQRPQPLPLAPSHRRDSRAGLPQDHRLPGTETGGPKEGLQEVQASGAGAPEVRASGAGTPEVRASGAGAPVAKDLGRGATWKVPTWEVPTSPTAGLTGL